MSRSRWNILPAPPDGSPGEKNGLPPLIARILFNRGITDPSGVEPFITADSRLSGDPSLLPGIPQATARIYRALFSGESIAVYGDFDTDGVTATALLVEGLGLLGARAIPYIPHRITEGYGVKTAGLEHLRRQGTSLVITVDCGITAPEPIKKAKKLGLDTIVTDHHLPGPEMPEAIAVIDPKLPHSGYPFSDLSGVGVALKLLQAVFQGLGKENDLAGLLDLVALGTVADVVPLLGENRYLVKQGLKVLNESPRAGIREMMALANLNEGSLSSDRISWVLAPRLNAAGRLDNAMASYELLTTQSAETAKKLAAWLQEKNVERQTLTAKAVRMAREQVGVDSTRGALYAGHADFPVGICGLVASRLAEEFYRPSVVVRIGEELSSGSCRSISEFNIINALNSYQGRSGCLVQYGGHAQAAGFTIPTAYLQGLSEYLCEVADTELAGQDLRPRIDIDVEVKLSDFAGNVYPLIQTLEPFGHGNPAPVFLSRRVEVLERRAMGAGGEHLRMRVRQNGTVWDAVAFSLGGRQSEITSFLDIVYNVEVDRWNGSDRFRLNILDFGASG